WPAQVSEVLRLHDLAAHDLELEVTEGQALSSSAQTDRSLADLTARGLLLSMDDFGMGSTSLLYMHRFKLHTIKLDGSLTREVCSNAVDRDIISCVCRLGHSQGVEVVAEYVETEAQRQMLESLGCDRFQGWLYSPALPADQFLDYLERQRSAM
ncbi:MAG: EAL domain-containing protein, partial [Curvibacter sp.]